MLFFCFCGRFFGNALAVCFWFLFWFRSFFFLLVGGGFRFTMGLVFLLKRKLMPRGSTWSRKFGPLGATSSNLFSKKFFSRVSTGL